MSYHRKLRRRLAAALEWSAVDKGMVIMGLLIPLYLQYLLWGWYVLAREDRDKLVDVSFLVGIMQMQGVMVVLGGLIVGAGLLLRKRHPDLPLFQYVTSLFFAASLSLTCYGIGTMSFPVGVALLGTPIFGFILIDRYAVWLATLTGLVLLGLLSYASSVGLIPYAPIVVPPGDQASQLFWTNSMVFFAAPFILVITLMADEMLSWWREREARIRQLSRTDALTGLHNRRSILDALDQELGRAARHGRPLSVVILDLDHFKRINDTWGHPAGDQVLRESARVLRENVRETDQVGRYGGEEFMIILPDADAAQAHAVLERCRLKLAGAEIITEAQQRLQVSASFGLVCDMAGGQLAHVLIHVADEALYKAKENGRNRIEVGELPEAATA